MWANYGKSKGLLTFLPSTDRSCGFCEVAQVVMLGKTEIEPDAFVSRIKPVITEETAIEYRVQMGQVVNN
jgi:hypothetical protein